MSDKKDILNKIIIISAPSGSGKTTMVQHLLKKFPVLGFSISYTSRKMRKGEKDGESYYFTNAEKFSELISNNQLLEWEEVYPGAFYGTPKSEIKRLHELHKIPIFDVDVVGGVNIKKIYKENALAIFIKTPSLKELEKRLQNRNTETAESLKKRIEKAKYELSFEKDFDVTVVNGDLEVALKEIESIVSNFITK